MASDPQLVALINATEDHIVQLRRFTVGSGVQEMGCTLPGITDSLAWIARHSAGGLSGPRAATR